MRLTYNYKEEYCETNAKRYDIDIEYLRKNYKGSVYLPNHNVRKEDMWHKLGQIEDVEEKLGFSYKELVQCLSTVFMKLVELTVKQWNQNQVVCYFIMCMELILKINA